MPPEVSVVVRAFNEERHLPRLFDGLDAQAFRGFETVLVDSGSFDSSREIAARRGAKVVRIPQGDFTFGHSLNVGVSQSAGRLIAIVSAHTAPTDSEWLGRLVAPLREEKNAMVYGRQRGTETSKYGELLDFERVFGPEPKTLRPPQFFANNANSAVRRDLWERHGFDETLPGLEDIEWAKHWMERGYRVIYEPRAGIYHIHQETWPQVRRRYYREGQAAKWIGVRGRRDIPAEVARELRWLSGDLARALSEGRISRLPEITAFRWNKLLGTARGIWDGAALENPLKRRRLLFDKPYKAVVIRGPGHAELSDVETPALKPGEALVRVAFQGVCATDLEILEGRLGYYANGLAHYPIVPGHELSGRVVLTGPRAEGIQEGDRVVVECIQGCGECAACKKGDGIGCAERREVGVMRRDGGYAEYLVCPARFCHRLPDDLSLRAAALSEPLAVVMKGLRRLSAVWGVEKGPRKIAVVGAGPVGHLAARVLALRGHSVTAFDRNPARLEHFKGSAIEGRSGLKGLSAFDALVEATGDPDALHSMLELSRAGSALLLLGLPYARREFSFETLVGYDKTVVGSVGSEARDFREALEALPRFETSAFLGKVFPLERFAEAWQAQRSGTHLKVMLKNDPTLPDDA